MQGGLMIWNRATASMSLRTPITLAIIAGLYVGAALVANRAPLQILISIATFDPWTGYYRMLIWEHGLENLWTSPWIGIGTADWERPKWMASSTIDAYWLVLPLRAGIPALFLLVTGIGLIGYRVVKRGRNSLDGLRRRMSAGWMMSLVAICLLGATVHFWNVPHALFYFFLGLGGALADPKALKRAVAPKSPTARRHPSFIRPRRDAAFPGGSVPV
jgi:O-antigen ligase